MANETLNIQNGVSPITIDTEVTEGSMRPVTSDGIYKAIQAGGGGGGLPTPYAAGQTLRTIEDGENVVWEQRYIHEPNDGFYFELGFDGETWTFPDFNFTQLTSQYKSHPLVTAGINGTIVVLQPMTSYGFLNFNFCSAILPLDDLGLTNMVGVIHLLYDGDAPGGWGISIRYWSASTM